MLELKNIECILGGVSILNIPQLTIKENGLYVFVGPSGCGKTTLLSIIAGLNRQYKGEMSVFNFNYAKMAEAELVRFRATYFSIFFQHNIFIESLTLSENINLVSLNNSASLQKFNHERNAVIGQKLKISSLLAKRVKTLSGGEKTRGGLARALSKESPLYLFDEPTAALDKDNARIVMQLIKSRSKKSIVLLVTHDKSLARAYADVIFTMQDGMIKGEEVLRKDKTTNEQYRPKYLAYEQNDGYIANGLLKAKKIRHVFTGGAVNIGLVGLGLSLLLVSAINHKLVSAFQGNFSEKTTYVESTITPNLSVIKSISTGELATLTNEETGAFYLNDMYTMFPSENKVSFFVNSNKFTLPSFHAGLFNEALFLNEIGSEIYPYVPMLASDEIGLVLPFDDYKLLQNAFRLPFRNSPVDLGNYLAKNQIVLTLNVANALWDYFDEQSFTLKTVMLGVEPQVIFGHPSAVIDLFEGRMLFPSSVNLTKIEEYPWVLKRINFVFTQERENFLWEALNYPDYVFSTANRDYFRYIFAKGYLNRRIMAFEKPPYFNDILKYSAEGLAPQFYTFTNGLSFVPDLMLLGYVHNFFVATSEDYIDEVITIDTNTLDKVSANFALTEGIINFALQFNGFGSFNFAPSQTRLKINEIIISKGLAEKLFNKVNVIGQKLFLGALTSIVQSGKDYIKEYATTSLTIVDVVENDEVVMYHDPLWNYLLFKDVFNVSPFSLHVFGLTYEANTQELELGWHYRVSKPFVNFKNTLTKTLNELETFTLVGALGAFLLSGLIIFLTIYLLLAEINTEFSGLYLLGYSRQAIQNVVRKYITRFLGGIIALALFELFIFSFVIELVLNEFLNTRFSYVFNFEPYVLVLLFSLTLLVFLISIFKKHMAKIDLLAFSKRDL